jgi:hypothetical protein
MALPMSWGSTQNFFAEPDDEEEQRAYLFGAIHNAPQGSGQADRSIDQVLAKP